MKKNLLVLGVMGVLGIGALVGCSTQKTNSLSDNTIKSMQAATTISMLDSNSRISRGMRMINSRSMEENEIKEVQKILPQLDLMLTNGDVYNVETFEEEVTINEVTYSYKDVISFKDSNLETVSYTLVYNKEGDVKEETNDKVEETLPEENKDATEEVLLANEDTVVEEDVNKEEGETKPETEKEEETEVETKESMNGLVLLNEETTYTFTSELKVEKETDEEETERSFKVMIDELNYVEVVQEHEIEGNEVESELAYKKVTNGLVELEYSIEIENEDGENEIEYEINNKEYKLTKETNENNENLYKVEVEIDGQKDQVAIFKKVVNEDETTSYEFVE